MVGPALNGPCVARLCQIIRIGKDNSVTGALQQPLVAGYDHALNYDFNGFPNLLLS
jgi:hypothetical protein